VSTAFITEAEQEPGSEAARSLIGRGPSVFMGPRRGAPAHAVAAEIGARFVQIDVLSEEAVAAVNPAHHDGKRER
jgi:hypothetical protein